MSRNDSSSQTPPRCVAFTTIAPNYIPKARALARSIKRHNPGIEFVLALVEERSELPAIDDEAIDRVLCLDDFAIPNLRSWLFKHNVVETCTAVKGQIALLLLRETSAPVVYFDPDILVLAPLDRLLAEFQNASILLTPHGTEPEDRLEAIVDNEISHLSFGVYNLGFLGLKPSADGMKFCRWWAERLLQFCYDDRSHGMFTDQRWVDLAPAFFEGVKVLRYPGYNVATWNLTHRVVEGDLKHGLTVNGQPLIFYHFSGFDSGAQLVMLNKYGSRSRALYELREWYLRQCAELGQDEHGARRWRFDAFEDGRPITRAQREVYRQRVDLQSTFADPFSTRDAQRSYARWYSEHRPMELAAQRHPPQVDCRIGRPYRVWILGTQGGSDILRQLEKISSATWQRARISLVLGPAQTRDLEPQLKSAASRLGVEVVTTELDRDDFILEMLAKSPDEDWAIVDIRMEPPELWDLRLHWHAATTPNLLSVSPLCDADPLFALGLRGRANSDANISSQEIDRIVFQQSHHELRDVPDVFEGCCFIKTEQSGRVVEQLRSAPATSLYDLQRAGRRLGLLSLVADDIYVDCVAETHDLALQAGEIERSLFQRRNALNSIRENSWLHFRDYRQGFVPSVSQRSRRRHLHVMHSWGGGLDRWVRSFAAADSNHANLMLKSVTRDGYVGARIALYASTEDSEPLRVWDLPQPIAATAITNWSYKSIFEEIIRTYGISIVFVSSLIGHSLDVYCSSARAVHVCHDYYPLSPAIYLRGRNLKGNRLFDFSMRDALTPDGTTFFPSLSLLDAESVRDAFVRIMRQEGVTLVGPSYSTRELWLDLAPDLSKVRFEVIPHGTPAQPGPSQLPTYTTRGRLRLVVIGRFAPQKGSELLYDAIGEITEFADVYLIGCGNAGSLLAGQRGVHIVPQYAPPELERLMCEIAPHAGLLLSDFPETFSYALDELFTFGVPPVATRIGAFCERIRDGVNGALVDANVDALVAALRRLDRNRDELAKMHAAIGRTKLRSDAEMVRDYEQVLDEPEFTMAAAKGAVLPSSTYERIPGWWRERSLLAAAERTELVSIERDYCFIRGDLVQLHPPRPPESDSKLVLKGIDLTRAVEIVVDVGIAHDRAADVLFGATVLGPHLESKACKTAAVHPGEEVRLALDVCALEGRHDVVFSTRMNDKLAGNEYAWAYLKRPRILLQP